MATDSLTGSLLGEEEDQYQPPTDTYTAGAADEGELGAFAPDEVKKKYLEAQQELQDILKKETADAYGPDADTRYKGTTALGLSMFQGHRQDRQPSYDSKGRVRGFRSAPGAPMATVPEGLIGGKALENQNKGVDVSNPFNRSLTPESDWRKTFGAKKQDGFAVHQPGIGGVSETRESVDFTSPTPSVNRNISSIYGTASARVPLRPNTQRAPDSNYAY